MLRMVIGVLVAVVCFLSAGGELGDGISNMLLFLCHNLLYVLCVHVDNVLFFI